MPHGMMCDNLALKLLIIINPALLAVITAILAGTAFIVKICRVSIVVVINEATYLKLALPMKKHKPSVVRCAQKPDTQKPRVAT